MWANLLNILSRSGLGSCLPPRDMRDEANNSVMGLLFLSGDWWDGSGGARAEEGAAGWKGRPGCCYGTHPSFRCSGAKQAEQAVSPPCVLEGRSATTPQQHAVCPSRLGHTLWPPRSQNISSRQLCAADIHRCLASSFVPSVKFPATSMGFHVQNTCDPWDWGATPGSKSLGLVGFRPTCCAVWKPLLGIKLMFLILVRWLEWEPRNPQLEAPSGDHLINSASALWGACYVAVRAKCWGRDGE